MRLRPALALLAVGLLAGGCAAEADGALGESEQDLTATSITLTGSGTNVTVEDKPRLTTGASGGFACDRRFEIDGRVRLTCGRGNEKLEVILREGNALLVHKEKRSADKETFHSCTLGQTGEGGMPKKLKCSVAPLRERTGGLVSPFDSTVAGIDIPNAHLVGSSGKLLRGMAPGSPADFGQLFAAKVEAVLIFKNPTTTGHDVGEETATLAERGLPAGQISTIPFKWKDIGPFEEPCKQTIAGLKFLRDNLAAGKKTLFHCTVGEDRTGYLAAMHKLLTEEQVDAGNAWDSEMCEHGYGAGNPLKPGFVVGALESSLKPLYRKMAYLAAKGQLDALDESVCSVDPESAADFAAVAPRADRLTCGTSTLFVP